MNPSLRSFVGFKLCTVFTLMSFGIALRHAQAETGSCQATLQAVRRRLQQQPNLAVVSITKRDISDAYDDYPQGRSDEYVVAMRGKQVTNLLNSPRLMTTLATQIIDNCGTTGLVMFGLANSGDMVRFGLMPDGKVQPFECLEAGRGTRRAVWGTTGCT